MSLLIRTAKIVIIFPDNEFFFERVIINIKKKEEKNP